ncbi:MAG: DMT family transporter [Paracoccus sp. (in: a-proteobacteria)]|nr:DMT family transporter [Paracoccus sp. (in: a-proteobacteria)]
MPVYELAALAAALCWAVTGLISAPAAAHLGPFGFNLYRQSMVTVALLGIVVITGGWQGVTQAQVWPLVLSGFIGIFLGDTLLYVSLNGLGPRRAGALFAMNAPMAAVLGSLFLDEALSAAGWVGVLACTLGTGIAVLGRPGRSGGHRFEAVQGSLALGVGCGLLAALGQATGSLIARPVMAEGFDPLTGSLIRVATAVACLSLLAALPVARFRATSRPTPRIWALTAVSGLMAMVIGMTLLLFALQGGKVGIVSTLSALSPVLILPLLWLVTGAQPSATSWAGALIAMAGMALIFLR